MIFTIVFFLFFVNMKLHGVECETDFVDVEEKKPHWIWIIIYKWECILSEPILNQLLSLFGSAVQHISTSKSIKRAPINRMTGWQIIQHWSA